MELRIVVYSVWILLLVRIQIVKPDILFYEFQDGKRQRLRLPEHILPRTMNLCFNQYTLKNYIITTWIIYGFRFQAINNYQPT